MVTSPLDSLIIFLLAYPIPNLIRSTLDDAPGEAFDKVQEQFEAKVCIDVFIESRFIFMVCIDCAEIKTQQLERRFHSFGRSSYRVFC